MEFVGFTKPEDPVFARKNLQNSCRWSGRCRKQELVSSLGPTTTLCPVSACTTNWDSSGELDSLPSKLCRPQHRTPRFFGKDKDVGTVEKGKIADLVLLDANPLDDIANTKKIASVIYGGTLLSRAQLDKILSDAEESGRPSIADILIETIDEKDVTAANHQYYDMKSTQPEQVRLPGRRIEQPWVSFAESQASS